MNIKLVFNLLNKWRSVNKLLKNIIYLRKILTNVGQTESILYDGGCFKTYIVTLSV